MGRGIEGHRGVSVGEGEDVSLRQATAQGKQEPRHKNRILHPPTTVYNRFRKPSSPAKGSEPRKSTKGIWIVSFMSYELGFIDLEQKTLQPLDNPFGPRLSAMS